MIKDITTRDMLQEYIKNILGAPVINIEITETQLNYCIDDAIREFSEVAHEGNEIVTLVMDLQEGKFEYILDGRIKNIKRLAITSASGINGVTQAGGVFLTPTELFASSVSIGSLSLGTSSALSNLIVGLANISMYNSLFNVPPRWDFNEYTKTLRFYENVNVKTDKILMEVYLAYTPREVDYIYNNNWVKSYATALAKKTWGNNVGKYEAVLIGGNKINYQRLIDEATKEIEELKAELHSKWVGPLGMVRA